MNSSMRSFTFSQCEKAPLAVCCSRSTSEATVRATSGFVAPFRHGGLDADRERRGDAAGRLVRRASRASRGDPRSRTRLGRERVARHRAPLRGAWGAGTRAESARTRRLEWEERRVRAAETVVSGDGPPCREGAATRRRRRRDRARRLLARRARRPRVVVRTPYRVCRLRLRTGRRDTGRALASRERTEALHVRG